MTQTPPPPPRSDPGPSSPLRHLAAGVASGVVAAAMVLTLVWLFTRPGDENGPAADAALACELLDRYDADWVADVLPREDASEEEMDRLFLMVSRVSAAHALALAAARSDDEYAALDDALADVSAGSRMYRDPTDEEMRAALERAAEECDAL